MAAEPPNKKPKSVGIKDIQKILECPVCLSTPKNPEKIHLCSNEHMICDDCHARVDKCPLCRSHFVEIKNNTLLKQILSALPKLCPYADEGCNIEPKDHEMENHKKNCQFRPIGCTKKSCNNEVPFESLLEHLQNSHNAYTEEYGDHDAGVEYDIEVKKETFENQNEVSWYPTSFKFDDKTFIFCVCKAKDHFYVQCFIYGNKEDERNYLCKIRVKDDNNSWYEISFTGDVISVDVPKSRRNRHFGTYSFSTSMAQALWDGQNLSFQLKLIKV